MLTVSLVVNSESSSFSVILCSYRVALLTIAVLGRLRILIGIRECYQRRLLVP